MIVGQRRGIDSCITDVWIVKVAMTINKARADSRAARMHSVNHGDKPVGSAPTWLRSLQHGMRDGDVKVPCGDCNACCRAKFHVNVTEAEAKELDQAYRDDQGWWLRKNADGSCVYLVDDRCSVYARRPRACRVYDCRTVKFFGLADPADPVMLAAGAQWQEFLTPTGADMELLATARRTAAAGVARYGWSVERVIAAALGMLFEDVEKAR